MANTKENIEKAKSKFENINNWISNCDTKSSFLLAFYGVLLTLVFTSDVINKIGNTFSLKPSLSDLGWTKLLGFLELISILAFFFFSLKCLYFIYNTLKARINSSIYEQESLNTDSNIFFQTIAQKSFKEYKNLSNSESDEDYLNDLDSQVFINSNIATEKFKAYNKSLTNAFIGILCLGIYLIIA